MNYCPLISYRNKYISEMDCFGSNCMFWDDEFKNCLISEYLICTIHPFHNLVSNGIKNYDDYFLNPNKEE